VREPRAVLAEFGTTVPDDVELRVWDSSAEVRYMVLPLAPDGVEGHSEDELAAQITRDHMIGVVR
jgi:nitrile hydratase